jgi:hypothetical protein
VLPPTFSGKYDQDQFTSFITDNLNALGYMSMCMAVVLTAQVCAVGRAFLPPAAHVPAHDRCAAAILLQVYAGARLRTELKKNAGDDFGGPTTTKENGGATGGVFRAGARRDALPIETDYSPTIA